MMTDALHRKILRNLHDSYRKEAKGFKEIIAKQDIRIENLQRELRKRQ